jgi:hypothetical protein
VAVFLTCCHATAQRQRVDMVPGAGHQRRGWRGWSGSDAGGSGVHVSYDRSSSSQVRALRLRRPSCPQVAVQEIDKSRPPCTPADVTERRHGSGRR